ncbi:MBL fold metallo-hydrolase [Thiothrix lacustris]|uniref:MBL fold metallo-hydrolase n=1 Tax=Thiothrix lacustris TaxID=525917 RepID=A0ABY9MK78_9GAMM|nr:MBL fold metallo-hydrolase [Thiothrix lacustris]WML89074.1 MBL fold metallo-hydrolase [Thiothrix lacustris]
MSIRFHFLPAGSGDSILIQTDDFVILVDSGDPNDDIAEELKEKITDALGDTKINWIILTHIDDDHIGGMKILLNDDEFLALLAQDCKIWMNYPNGNTTIFDCENSSSLISYSNADRLKDLVDKKIIQHVDKVHIEEYQERVLAGNHVYLEIISPNHRKLERLINTWSKYTKSKMISAPFLLSDYNQSLSFLTGEPDNKACSSIPNGSSIAFILTYLDESKKENKFLFLADSHTGIIRKSLENKGYSESNPIIVNFVKISHHGSKYNTNRKLMSLIDSENFIFLTDDNLFLPHKKTIERIINRKHNKKSKTNLIFNYECTTKKLISDKCISIANINITHQDFIEY